MSKRDWQLDWWSVISYDALDCPKPGTEKEWFEKRDFSRLRAMKIYQKKKGIKR